MDDLKKQKRSGCLVYSSALALVALGGWLLMRSLSREFYPAAATPELASFAGR